MIVSDVFYEGGTTIWQDDNTRWDGCRHWADAVLKACAVAIDSLPHKPRQGNIWLTKQYLCDTRCSIDPVLAPIIPVFTAELKGGKNQSWLMKHILVSCDIVSEALRGIYPDGIQHGVFAEQISARLGKPCKKSDLPPSGVYHYGDFVAMVMNGERRRFMASLSIANNAPQCIHEHDLVLLAIATALNRIFGEDDPILANSYKAVLEDLENYTALMRWSRTELAEMRARIDGEICFPTATSDAPKDTVWEMNKE